MPLVEAMTCTARMDEISDGLAIKVRGLDINARAAAFRH
jgi:hypothetical protein